MNLGDAGGVSERIETTSDLFGAVSHAGCNVTDWSPVRLEPDRHEITVVEPQPVRIECRENSNVRMLNRVDRNVQVIWMQDSADLNSRHDCDDINETC